MRAVVALLVLLSSCAVFEENPDWDEFMRIYRDIDRVFSEAVADGDLDGPCELKSYAWMDYLSLTGQEARIVRERGVHAWVEVKIDGRWQVDDPTWGIWRGRWIDGRPLGRTAPLATGERRPKGLIETLSGRR